MAISKSTPYVRYKENFSSTLHLGTIHIESEYLDRTQKTTIESIHGMTWHNKVVNENKELNLLSDSQLELTELERQYFDTGEKRVSVDEVQCLQDVTPNEDGTYTYTVSSMEGEYAEIYQGYNNIISTSDGLDGNFEIVYDTDEEDITGNIALDSVAPTYTIEDSGIGVIDNGKISGLTLVNSIVESSSEEIVAIGEHEGQYFTINNTVAGNIKNTVIKGNTEIFDSLKTTVGAYISETTGEKVLSDVSFYTDFIKCPEASFKVIGDNRYKRIVFYDENKKYLSGINTTLGNNADYLVALSAIPTQAVYLRISASLNSDGTDYTPKPTIFIKDMQGNNLNMSYLISVKNPVLTTTGKNLYNPYLSKKLISLTKNDFNSSSYCTTKDAIISLKPNTKYKIIFKPNGSVEITNSYALFGFKLDNKGMTGLGGVNVSYRVNQNETPKLQETEITTDNTGNLYMFRLDFGGADSYINDVNLLLQNTDVQIEEASTYTEYEPYKSNILTVNEEVELRGIGEVKDELDLLTGELKKNISDLETLDDVSKYSQSGTTSSTTLVLVYPLMTISSSSSARKFMSTHEISKYATLVEWYGALSFKFSLPRSDSRFSDSNTFKTYIESNPFTYVRELEEKERLIQTVETIILDQDNNPQDNLHTFDTVTHIYTSSDGLTPVVEMSCSYDTIIKPNITYTIKLVRPIVSDTMYLQVDLGGTMMMLDADVNAFTIKTPSTLSHSQLRLSGVGNTVKEIIVLEGNRVNDKIEYFEGMKNVENPILIVSNCPYVFGKGGRL